MMESPSMISAAPKVAGLLKGLKGWSAKYLVKIACFIDNDAAAAAQRFPPLTLDEGRKLGLPICNPNPDHPRNAHVCMEVRDDPTKQEQGIAVYQCPECGSRKEKSPPKHRSREPVRSNWLENRY